jgi:hypothetical protein
MKKYFYLLLLVAGLTIVAKADEEKKEEEKGFFGRMKDNVDKGLKKLEGTDEENLKYYREKFEETYTEFLFEDVWDACKESIAELKCDLIQESSRLDDEGFNKGKIKTSYCIFAMEENDEDVADSLWKYSYKVPVIRGADWVSGRVQYIIIIKDNDDDTVYMRIKGEISGREDQITNEVHFWDSNGWFEHHLLERINEKLAAL